MGAQQSRSGSQPASEGHTYKLARHLKRHSSVDKLFTPSSRPSVPKSSSRPSSLKSISRPSSLKSFSRSSSPRSLSRPSSAAKTPPTVSAQERESEGDSAARAFQRNASPISPVAVPCFYRIGRTLGSGTYAIVKEAVHIQTGKYYACKVINKKLMEGREHMVRNEITVLKRISSGHPNIVTLHDHFETTHNLYLCLDLCTGGELFDRICAKGNYYEADAADLVRVIFKAVKYIHDSGIVHHDLAAENLLFRTPAEDADIMVVGFGLSRVIDDQKLTQLTDIRGTPGYMAPEIWKRTGHGKPVDVWAVGVITYFLLAGYTPFDRDTQQQEMEAIIAGDYKFEPAEYWANVSDTAKDFVRCCLTADPAHRPTAARALEHKWLIDERPHSATRDSQSADLLPHVKRAFNAKQAWRKVFLSIVAIRRMTILVQQSGNNPMRSLRGEYKRKLGKEVLESTSIPHQHKEEEQLKADEFDGKPDLVACDSQPADLPTHVRKDFNAKQTWHKAAFSIIAVIRMRILVRQFNYTPAQELRAELARYKKEALEEISAMEEPKVNNLLYQLAQTEPGEKS